MVCAEYGPLSNLSVGELPNPEPGPDDVLIDVVAAGVNFADILMVAGTYQMRAPLPFAPGFEVSGRIADMGPRVHGVQIGQEVMAYMLYGGYAERAVVPSRRLRRVPVSMDLVTAAAVPATFGTAYHALFDRGDLKTGETLAVLGAAGAIGSAAVILGKAVGATVIAAVGSATKATFVQGLGADAVINYEAEDLREALRSATDSMGTDVVFDPVGGDAFDPALRSLRWGGRHLVLGFASGEIPKAKANLTLIKGISVVGVWWGRFTEEEAEADLANHQQLVELFDAGKIRIPLDETYPLEQAADALARLASRTAMGKTVLTVT